MSGRTVLVTGGAGFVGSHLVDALIERGDRVRVFDNLDPQVHGPGARKPEWLSDEAELIVGDMRDRDAVSEALGDDTDVVYHLAAAVGVGQSMYQIVGYTAVNTLGTANLLQSIVDREIRLQRLVVASSMSIYGEGQYARPDGQYVTRALRPRSQLQSREWEVRDADGTVLSPVPTAETKQLHPTSIYALTKADQEQMTLQIGAAYDIPAVALRFFNIYGPRQALSNPYTGVAAIFSSRLLNGERPLIFEDGEQRRDFVSVHDVVRSLLLAAESDRAVGKAINIGSGRAVTIRQVAATLARVLGVDIEPEINGKYRVGDIRHCYADITIACETLGYAPRVSFEEGMEGLVEWLRQQRQPKSSLRQHAEELALRGLTL